MIAYLKAWFVNVADMFASAEFDGVDSRRRAQEDMCAMKWRRDRRIAGNVLVIKNRWVDVRIHEK